MKVLHITPQLEPELGGIATFSSRLVGGLRARGYDQQVIASHGRLSLPDHDDVGGVPVHRLPFYAALESRDAGGLLRCRLQTAAVKRRFEPDLVHLHIGAPVAFLHLSTERESTAATVVTVHDLPNDVSQSQTLMSLIARAHAVAANSNARLDDLRRALPGATTPLQCIYPVIPPEAADGGTGRRDAEPLLLTGGRLVPEKGFDTALEALALVRVTHPAARLVITGDGDYRDALVGRAQSLGLQPAVQFTGVLPPEALASWRRRAWITLVPSTLSESFGLVALEAMRAGSAVIASRVGGLPEVVAESETGLLVPPGDPRALADAIESLLSDESRMFALGRAGRLRAQAFFDVDRCLDAYDAMFRAAMDSSARTHA